MSGLTNKQIILIASAVVLLALTGVVVVVSIARQNFPPPEISLSVSSPQTTLGKKVTITWSVQGAERCEASGAWTGERDAERGTERVTAEAEEQEYTLTCAGPGGTQIATTTVEASFVEETETGLSLTRRTPPIVRFLVMPPYLHVKQRAQLTWSTVSAQTCLASGDWSGERQTSGAQNIYPEKSSAFVLTCVGTGGTAMQTATVAVVEGDDDYQRFFDTTEYRVEVVTVTVVSAMDNLIHVEMERSVGGRKTISTGSFAYTPDELVYFHCGQVAERYAFVTGKLYRLSTLTIGTQAVVAVDRIEACM